MRVGPLRSSGVRSCISTDVVRPSVESPDTQPMSDPTPSLPAPGAIFAGKYRVERIIGQRRTAVLLDARHIRLDERRLIKLVLPEHAPDRLIVARFRREARATGSIDSEHVLCLYDVGEIEDGRPYMVMEPLNGLDLSQVLERDGVLPLVDAVDYVIQGCKGIAAAHAQGIIHLNLQPQNLFLNQRPDGTTIIKVLDFGFSKTGVDVSAESLVLSKDTRGSSLNLSSERGVDHRADIYALGITLYQLLTGKLPFHGDTLPQLLSEKRTGTPTPLRTLRPDAPEALAAVLEKAYARDPEQRHASITDFVIALSPFAPPR